jgi:dTDP-glucose pyrophosphorylase/CBS domain-containing protein
MVGFDAARFCVRPDQSIRDAVACIDGNECGIALVTDGRRHILGTVTDGDIRRAMLANVPLTESVSAILDIKAKRGVYPPAITAPVGTDSSELLSLMHSRKIRQIPLVDADGGLVSLVTLDELTPPEPLALDSVIMAGGFGTRLRPLTESMPKPMLPVGGKPLIERIVEQLRDAGIRSVNITTHYKPEAIVQHFGSGDRFGVDIRYLNEAQPMGTAGAIALIDPPQRPFLVVNGDILTQVNYRAMLAFHEENQADLTVGVQQYEFRIPYGVLETEGAEVRRISEKPLLRFLINAGIYILQPEAYHHIPQGTHYDMPQLIDNLLRKGKRVVSFPIREHWLDVGQPADYLQAQELVKKFEVQERSEGSNP